VPPRATGRIDPHHWADGKTITWRLQVRAYGRRKTITLGTNHEGWNEERAQVELDKVIDQIARGTWRPPESRPAAPIDDQAEDETIHVTLSRWWQRKKTEVAENTRKDYEWRLSLILGFRPNTPTSDIDAQWVDELRDHLAKQKARNRKKPQNLSPRSVNMCLDILAPALDLAVRHKILDANAARTKGTKLKVPKSSRSFLEPDMVIDLLEVAGEWEAELPEHQRYGRRAFLALLCLGGPRISEATKADRGEFDLAGDHWRIPEAKTDAGERTLELTVFCAEEQRGHVASTASLGRPIRARDPMYPTLPGGRLNDSNIRERLLGTVVERANERREAEGKMLLPEVTPHSLRRTFASLCYFAGRDPVFVMGQLGHTDPRLALAIYAQTMQRKRIDRDLVWKLMRFHDEPEAWPGGRRSAPTIDTTAPEKPSGRPARIPGA
jgi:integrase